MKCNADIGFYDAIISQGLGNGRSTVFQSPSYAEAMIGVKAKGLDYRVKGAGCLTDL